VITSILKLDGCALHSDFNHFSGETTCPKSQQ
jgi:hypothetical protein